MSAGGAEVVDVGCDGVGGEGGAVPMLGETGAAVGAAQVDNVTTTHLQGPAGLPPGGASIDDADGPVVLVDEPVMGAADQSRLTVPLSTSVGPWSRPHCLR